MAKKLSLTVKNIHGTFTAASEEAIEYMLSTASQHAGLAKRMFEVWEGCEHPVTGKLITEAHCRRYSERSLAIMLCDVYADDVAAALERIHETHAKETAEAEKAAMEYLTTDEYQIPNENPAACFVRAMMKVGAPVKLADGTRGRVTSLRTADDGVVEVTITRIGGTLVVPAGLVEVL